jgi:hypothetical protein
MTEAAGRSRLARRYPFGVAVAVFALVVWLDLGIMLDGFPDGFMSDLDRAEHGLTVVFDRIGLAMVFWCMCLGVVAGRWDVRKLFLYACALYSAVIFVSLLIDLYFRATLMDSRGG